MKARTAGEKCVDEWCTEVKAATRLRKHSFDEPANFAGRKHEWGQFADAVPVDEDFARRVDPDFFDLRIVEERLQGTETSDACGHFPHGRLALTQRGDFTTGGFGVVLVDDCGDEVVE